MRITRRRCKLRRLIYDDYRKAFAQVDCVLGPTTPSTAFRLGEKIDDPVQMYLEDLFTLARTWLVFRRSRSPRAQAPQGCRFVCTTARAAAERIAIDRDCASFAAVRIFQTRRGCVTVERPFVGRPSQAVLMQTNSSDGLGRPSHGLLPFKLQTSNFS